MIQLYKIRKIEFLDKIEKEEITSLLLFDNDNLVGYTHNTEWITAEIVPDDLKVNYDSADDFTIYFVEIYNEEMKMIHIFCWKQIDKVKSWVFLPTNFECLKKIEHLPEHEKNNGYTLLVDNRSLDALFDLTVINNKNKVKQKPIVFHASRVREREWDSHYGPERR